MKTRMLLLNVISAFLFVQFTYAQSSDPVLFTVSGKPVNVSEFDYIYKKTNGAQATYSRESLEEYLDLYVKFKLKVQRARDMELDTITSLSRELEGYRRQLADSYLVDKEVTEKLVNEVYERMKTEREVAHILFKFKNFATAEDSAVVLEKAGRVLEMLKKGGDFERMAIGQSEDPNVMNTKGNLGFVTAMLPNGFYQMENAVYNTPIGKVSDLIYSPMGLHIIKVLQERPERGEVEVSHILIRDTETAPVADAEKKIREAYAELKSGKSFEDVSARFSDDKVTANKGGYLGFFGINRYEQTFEDAAFGLESDNTFSEPFKTKLGWHIVKRISRKGLEPLQKIKGRLQIQVAQDGRYEAAKMRMIEQVKMESGFKEFPGVLDKYNSQLDLDFLTYKWKPDTGEQKEQLFVLNDGKASTTGDFSEFLLRNQRKRLQMARDSNVIETANELYKDFVAESMIKFAERKLETKYPEFRALMREYEEGILLFEATKMKVWDKASRRTGGVSQQE
jgi:peptidyl-prolyl cis-trans isomerase SurA